MDYTKCNSASDFETKFRGLLAKLDVAEKEETWQQLDAAVKNLTSLVKAGATKYESFVPLVRRAAEQVNKVVGSERTRLNGSGLVLIEEMARRLETRFGPICELVFPTALKSCGRANKVFVTRGVSCLSAVITHSHAADQTPRICAVMATDLNKGFRASAAKLLLQIVSCCTAPELAPHMAVVEEAIAKGIVDANPDARSITKKTYDVYIRRFSSRKDSLHSLLDSTAKKYLKIGDSATTTTTTTSAASTTNSASSSRPASRFAAFRQRQAQPMRDRLAPQRPNGHTAPTGRSSGNAVGSSAAEKPPTAHQRLRPVRPVARHASAMPHRETTPMILSTSTAPPVAKPGSASAPCSIEPLHLSASNASVPAANKPISEGNSPTMTVFDDVESAAAAEAKDDASAPAISQEISSENSPAPATEQPVETAAVEDIVASATSGEPPAIQEQGSSSNLPTSGRTTPTEQSKNPDSKPAATRASTTDTAKTTAARAHRMHGLSFSSLKGSAGSSGPRTPHAVRPAARNIVTSRMEEALRGRPRARPRPKPVEKAAPTTRARRPVRTAATHADKSAAESPSRRMTLRSDTKIEPLTSLDDNVPGYLRATAASAHRTAELAGEQRSTRRRKREGSQEPSSEEPAAKATKTDAVAAANAVSSN